MRETGFTLFIRLTEMSTSEPTVAILSSQRSRPFTIWRLMENGPNTVLHFKAGQYHVHLQMANGKTQTQVSG